MMRWRYKWLLASSVLIISLLLSVHNIASKSGLYKLHGGTGVLGSGEQAYLMTNYNGMTDVRLFGAKGDGVTDDTKAIQSAVDCGGNILIADGTFIVDSQFQRTVATDRGTVEQPDGDPSVCGIKINNSCNIICKNAVIKTKPNSEVSLGNSYLFVINVERVAFEGVVIDGNRYNAEHSYGIQINASDCNFVGLRAYRFDGSPLVINGTPSNYVNAVRITDFYAENVGNTIFAVFSKNNIFNGIRSINSSEGIDFDKMVSDTVITDCYFEGGTRTRADAGIEINAGNNINIEKVVAVNYRPILLLNGKKINGKLERSHNINAHNITSINSLGHGMTIGNVFKNGDDIDLCKFTNVTIINPRYSGIQIRGTNCEYNNISVSGARTGIYSVNGAKNITLNGIINNCIRDGIHISNTDNFKIYKSIIADNNSDMKNYNGILCDGNNRNLKLNKVSIKGKHKHAILAKGNTQIELVDCSAQGSLSSYDYCFSKNTVSILANNIGTFGTPSL